MAALAGAARAAQSDTTRTLVVKTPAKVVPAATEAASVRPPLSVNESCVMLKQIIEELEARSESPAAARIQQLDRMFGAINLYIERIDRANPMLPNYKWREVLTQRVTESAWQNLSYQLKTPLENISAVALRARHGDIQLNELVAVEENGTQWKFDKPMLMTDGEAHIEICLLPLPARLKQIKLSCRQAVENPKRYPKLIVEAGVSPTPEYARHARYCLQLARADLAAKKPMASAANLRRTFELLQAHQKTKKS